jgi:hypothetical protein
MSGSTAQGAPSSRRTSDGLGPVTTLRSYRGRHPNEAVRVDDRAVGRSCSGVACLPGRVRSRSRTGRLPGIVLCSMGDRCCSLAGTGAGGFGAWWWCRIACAVVLLSRCVGPIGVIGKALLGRYQRAESKIHAAGCGCSCMFSDSPGARSVGGKAGSVQAYWGNNHGDGCHWSLCVERLYGLQRQGISTPVLDSGIYKIRILLCGRYWRSWELRFLHVYRRQHPGERVPQLA